VEASYKQDGRQDAANHARLHDADFTLLQSTDTDLPERRLATEEHLAGQVRGHTIISTALPKVALINPPMTDPNSAASCSVEKVRMDANGNMARKFRVKTAPGLHSHSPAMMPRGTQKSSTLE
jgi:hypothetical protein